MKFKLKYIIVNESDWDEVLEIGKKYCIYYDEDNAPYVLDERNERRFDIFHFDDDFEFSN